MAYDEKAGKRQNESDKKYYKKVGIKVKKEIFAIMQSSKDYQNNNQFLNMLIIEKLKKDGLIDDDEK